MDMLKIWSQQKIPDVTSPPEGRTHYKNLENKNKRKHNLSANYSEDDTLDSKKQRGDNRDKTPQLNAIERFLKEKEEKNLKPSTLLSETKV